MWSLAKLIEAVRWQGLKHGFIHYPRMCHGTNLGLFVVGQWFKISENLHDLHNYDNSYGIDKPLHFIQYVSNVGKSSFSFVLDWIERGNGEILVRVITNIVLVNLQTRRPETLPEYFFIGLNDHLKLAEAVLQTTEWNRKMPLEDLKMSYRVNIKVLHSDVDMYGHVNQATYFKWCSDATSEAAKSGHLPRFTKHIERYSVKEVQAIYKGEALANEVVTVAVQRNGEEDNVVTCAIENKGNVIFTMKMSLYDKPAVSVDQHLESKL
ncbi:uncharacterized protein LOC127860371 isoform X5 [Dreissena polymorpha]|nr:uncharacterized protein LOC127860371 isoform X5 [Dreissena polymorpha]